MENALRVWLGILHLIPSHNHVKQIRLLIFLKDSLNAAMVFRRHNPQLVSLLFPLPDKCKRPRKETAVLRHHLIRLLHKQAGKLGFFRRLDDSSLPAYQHPVNLLQMQAYRLTHRLALRRIISQAFQCIISA